MQYAILGRVDLVDAGPDDRDGTAACFESGMVGGCVNPSSQARHHSELPGDKLAGKFPRHGDPLRGSLAGADDRHGNIVRHDVPGSKEHRWRLLNAAKAGWVRRIKYGNQTMPLR